ncbi:MAG: hypothetical protein II937_13830 [Bacteroidales bacterium]|nr:hypothetical protein [Bacteroidales bacterium]
MAEESNGGLVFGIRLDNSQLARDIEQARKLFDSLSKGAGDSGSVISGQVGNAFADSSRKAQQAGGNYNKVFQDLYVAATNAGAKVRGESQQTATSISADLNKLNAGFTSITGLAGAMFLGVSAKGIVDQMFQTRSYFQDAESSMKVFLGDAQKGTKFINELKDYAFYNMFEFKDLVGASKQLISYGTAAKDVTNILDQLSNIATGTGANLNDMVGMYNKAKSVGKVDSQGLESWAARGVLVKETLRDMGETVSSTGVTFQQLEKVLAKVTGEGGMFHNLMAEQLDNLSASAAQLSDNMTAMYNEMGEKAEPYMKAAIDLAGTLVENYQSIADVIIDVAKVYGAYKLVDMSGIQGIIEQTEAEQNLVDTFKEHAEEIKNMFSADQAYEMELSGLKEGTAEYAQAVKDMFEAEKQNTSLQLENITKLESAETARIETLVREREEIKQKIFAAEQSNDVLQKEALTAKAATIQAQLNASQDNLSAISKQKKAIAANASSAAIKAETLATMQSTTATKAATTASMLWNKATTALGKGITKLGNLLKSTLLSNPYALAIAGAVALCQAIYDIVNAQSAMEEAQGNIDAAKAKGFEEATKELQKTAIPDFDKIRNLTEGTDEYQKALDGLIKKYPELAEVITDNTTKEELLAKGYDAVKKSIIEKNQAAAMENAVAENAAKVSEKQQAVIDEFQKQLTEQGYSIEDAYRLSTDFQVALMDGLKPEEMSAEIQKVFEDAASGTQKCFKGALAGATFGLTDFLNIGNYTNSESWAGSIKEKFMSYFTDNGYKEYDSKLGALMGRMEQFKDAADKAAEGVKNLNNEVDVENQKKLSNYLNTELLKTYKDDVERAKGELEGGIKLFEYEFRNGSQQNKTNLDKKVKELQKNYVQAQKALRDAQKYVYGDDLSAQEAKYKKSIELYKQFASEYTKLEIKRQNDIQNLERSRDKQGANQGIIDMQIEDVNKKADDNLNLLFAKFYNVSDKTAEQIKTVFSNALEMPVDKAKDRLAQITTELEKIKNAAANGNNIASKEKQAALTAEKAGLEQNIAKAEEKLDYSEKTKKYESFYNELVRIANEKEQKIAELQSKQSGGIINEQKLKEETEKVEAAFTSQANIIRQQLGMTEEETTDMILGKIGSATNTEVNSLMNTLSKLETEIGYFESKIGEIDVSKPLTEAREALNETLADLEFITTSGVVNLEQQIQEAQNNLVALETRAAKGEDVAKEIAMTKAQISQLQSKMKEYVNVQHEVADKTTELTEAQQKLENVLAQKAAYQEAAKNYGLVKNAVNNVIDGCEGLSDTTKDVLNGMMELGDILFDTIGGLLEYAEQSAQSMVTAGVAASEAVKTAEKGSAILAVIGAAIQAVMAIVKIFNKHGKTAKAEKNIEKIEGQVKDLDRAYDKLGDKMENAYATDATNIIQQQDKLLAQKEALIRQEIREEQSKKKKKQDDDKIKEWRQELEDIAETRAKTQQTITETLIGKNYKSVLEDFSGAVMSAMDDAETSVDDAVKNISKSIKKSAIQQQLMQRLQPKTDEYAKALGDAMTDGVISDTEKKVLTGLEGSIARISEDYLGQFDDLWETAEAERQASSGGITNMSQDSADEMNGRLTQMQSHTFSINENVKQMREFASQQLIVLRNINTDTSALVKTVSDMKATVDDIQIKGVKLK